MGRVGGHTMARHIHDICQEHDVPVWCGGMLETGVGRAHNVHFSTLPQFKLPGDVSASKRYWKEDIIEPAVEVTPDGLINVPDAPGTGFKVKEELIAKLSKRTATIR